MNLGEYIIYIFNFAVMIGAVLAFIVIAYNGIKLLASRDNVAQMGEVKKRIINALLGLTILLVSFLLLRTINPSLVDIKNISIGNISVSIPTFSIPTETTTGNYSFEEIPIGTLVESILAGTSSNDNALPCYEYEHDAYDDDGNLIIANTVDRNGDGTIDKKDALLDKDVFYCIKLLDDAIKKKTEVHLNKLISELNQLMQQCKCSRCHSGHFEIEAEPDDCVPENEVPGFVYPPASTCPYCIQAKSFCRACGLDHVGCTEDPDNKYDPGFASNYDGFKQYEHDPCPNRLEIDCKRQEIKQLIDGSTPDAICYKEVNDRSFLKKAPSNLFTIKQGKERLEEFKQYYDNQVSKLEAAEKKIKFPSLEKITLSEYHLLENTDLGNVISKESFNNIDSSRYCSDFECVEGFTVNGSYTCTKGKLSDEKRVCRINSSTDQEYYFYEGDPATFYYGYQYDKDQETYPTEEKESTCYVSDGSISKGEYQGLIPIGEAVDGTEAYGTEVSYRIEKLEEEVQGISNTGMSIYNMPNSCDCTNCKSGNVATACYKPCCSKDGCGDCFCPDFMCLSCKADVPIEIKRNADGTPKYILVNNPCVPYSTCKGKGTGTKSIEEPESDYWTCPYGDFCLYVKALYQRKSINDSCYNDTDKETEKNQRNTNLSQVGYVQKFEKREEMLFQLAAVGEMKDEKEYESVGTANLINDICPEYRRQPDKKTLTCDGGTTVTVENRFTLLQKLTTSRQRMLGCVTGYGVSYKKGANKARVFSCQEGINYMMLSNLSILPNFPYPTNETYWNCYPFNSSNLSVEEQKACRNNKDKEVTDSNGPACQEVINEYMDNYYCCE